MNFYPIYNLESILSESEQIYMESILNHNPIRIAITGAAGQIGYSLVFRIKPVVNYVVQIDL